MKWPKTIKDGAPADGTPGGHVGEWLVFASCTNCHQEWVWVKAGIPNSMRNCACPDEQIMTISFKATAHGWLFDVHAFVRDELKTEHDAET